MLQAANLFNPLVPKAHNSECQTLLFSLQIKLIIFLLADFLFFTPSRLGTNWLLLA